MDDGIYHCWCSIHSDQNFHLTKIQKEHMKRVMIKDLNHLQVNFMVGLFLDAYPITLDGVNIVLVTEPDKELLEFDPCNNPIITDKLVAEKDIKIRLAGDYYCAYVLGKDGKKELCKYIESNANVAISRTFLDVSYGIKGKIDIPQPIIPPYHICGVDCKDH